MQVAVVVIATAVAALVRLDGVESAGRYDRPGLRMLARAGYYPGSERSVDSMTDEEVAENLRQYLPDMQRFYRVGRTAGELDSETLKMMSERNCDNKDAAGPTWSSRRRGNGGRGRSRVKRYSYLGNSFWTKGRELTFGFKDFVAGFSVEDQIDVAKGCARLWGEASSLEFRYVDPSEEVANILITYAYIDGEFSTVGKAQNPGEHRNPQTSVITLDNGETWRARQLSPGPFRATVFEEALCHEMGHTLGLSHSNERDAIMYPSVGNRPENTKLHSDDINGIQSIYGPSNGRSLVGDPSPPRPTNPPPTSAPRTDPPRTNPPPTTPRPTNPPQTAAPRTDPPPTEPPRTNPPPATPRPTNPPPATPRPTNPPPATPRPTNPPPTAAPRTEPPTASPYDYRRSWRRFVPQRYLERFG